MSSGVQNRQNTLNLSKIAKISLVYILRKEENLTVYNVPQKVIYLLRRGQLLYYRVGENGWSQCVLYIIIIRFFLLYHNIHI